jgi:hypothetical protein
VDWTSVGSVTRLDLASPPLPGGRAYVVGVRARNGVGLLSPPEYSPPVALPPESPSTVYEGFGTETAGGGGQPLYRVTTLADAGPGSLRDALSQGSRRVVFEIAGIIQLESPLSVQGALVTIDGFTAPSPGITLTKHGLVMRERVVDGKPGGAHDVIVRGIRVRDADATISTDCIEVSHGAFNIVIDHVSVSGCADGAIDVTEEAHDVTVSWSLLAEPTTDKTMLVKYDAERITLHHNLFVGGASRNPHINGERSGASDTTVDMRNNVVWDWGGGSGTLVRSGAWANVIDNVYGDPGGSPRDRAQALVVCKGDGIETPETAGLCDNGHPESAARAHLSGNVSVDGVDLDRAGNEAMPFPAPPVTTESPCWAALRVTRAAGAPNRDTFDQTHAARVAVERCPRR